MSKFVVIKSIEELKIGMEIIFRHNCLSDAHEAVVSNVNYDQKCRFIDSKPVRALSIKSVDLKCLGDKIITVRKSNFQDFYICKR